MKKYTNKILIITGLILALGLILSTTVNIQKEYKNHPYKFSKIIEE